VGVGSTRPPFELGSPSGRLANRDDPAQCAQSAKFAVDGNDLVIVRIVRIPRDDPRPASRSMRGRAFRHFGRDRHGSTYRQGDDDGSGIEREIEWLIGLFVADSNQAVVQSARFTLLGLGPAAFGQLTTMMYATEDDRLRLRAIEVLGLSSQSHHGAIPILIAAWGVLVDPSARAAIQRALCATLLILSSRCGNSRPEPGRRGRDGPRRRGAVRP
jgi:hypothetical protein